MLIGLTHQVCVSSKAYADAVTTGQRNGAFSFMEAAPRGSLQLLWISPLVGNPDITSWLKEIRCKKQILCN